MKEKDKQASEEDGMKASQPGDWRFLAGPERSARMISIRENRII